MHCIPTPEYHKMSRVEEARKHQLEEVGSDELYNRLDKKLAHLEVDPTFYKTQMRLYDLRCRILKENTRYNTYEISFLSTQRFEQVLEELEFHQVAGEIQESSIVMGKEAMAKFETPNSAAKCLLKIHNTKPSCKCEDCKTNLRFAWQALKDAPDASPFTELAIKSCLVGSLKELCSAKVVEQGLGQEDLPLTLRQGIARGPQLGDLEPKGERAVQILKRIIKDQEPKIEILDMFVVDPTESNFPGLWLRCEMQTSRVCGMMYQMRPLVEREYLEEAVDFFVNRKTADGDIILDQHYRELVIQKLLDVATQVTENPAKLPQMDVCHSHSPCPPLHIILDDSNETN